MEAAGPAAAGYIARWRPSSVSAEGAAFARDVVAKSAPEGRDRAKSLLWAAGKLADYGIGLGLEAVPVLARYQDRLLAAAASAGAGLICVGGRAVHPVRAGPVACRAADAADEPAVHRPPRRPAAVSGGPAAAPGTGQEALQPGRDQRVPRAGRCPADGGAADARGRAHLPGGGCRVDPR